MFSSKGEVFVTHNPGREATACRQLIRILSSLKTEVPMAIIIRLHQGTFDGASDSDFLGGLMETIKEQMQWSSKQVAQCVIYHMELDDKECGEGIVAMRDVFKNIHLGDKLAHDGEEFGNQYVKLLRYCCEEALQKIEELNFPLEINQGKFTQQRRTFSALGSSIAPEIGAM